MSIPEPFVSTIVRPSETEAIVYDPSQLNQAGPELFERGNWARSVPVGGRGAGRGSTWFVSDDERSCALRHYYRGGFARKISKDCYLFVGEDKTRSFAEWRLLATLREWELPVPRPVAARYRRHALCYTADILTERLPDVHPLSDLAATGALDRETWVRIGRTIRRFHDRSVYHADLNAHNVMISSAGVYLLDFDRGALRDGGAWRAANLQRLHRSLDKLARDDAATAFGAREWAWFAAGYDSRA